MPAVMSDDSIRHGSLTTACAAASTSEHTTARSAALTSSSTGVGATSPKKDTTNATRASPASESSASRYMETRPSTAKTRFHSEVKVPIT